VRSSSLARGNLSVAGFCNVRGIRLVVGKHDEALLRGVVAPGAGVVGVAEPVVHDIEEPPEHDVNEHQV
jgi:hypothetical protein